jgi:hypothetical protein
MEYGGVECASLAQARSSLRAHVDALMTLLDYPWFGNVKNSCLFSKLHFCGSRYKPVSLSISITKLPQITTPTPENLSRMHNELDYKSALSQFVADHSGRAV